MNESYLKQVSRAQFAYGSFWKLLEVVITKGISFVITIILARLLAPEDYGIIEITTIFIAFSDIFIQAGFTPALIRKQRVDDADYSSVFTISLMFATLIYLIIFIAAPYIAAFYDEEKLIAVLRVIAIVLFFQTVIIISNAKVTRDLRFRIIFVCTGISNIISGIISIVMALMGFKVWALVGQQISFNLIYAMTSILILKWKPRFALSWPRIKDLFSFGKFAFLSSVIDYTGNNVTSLAIGKVYSPESLACYGKGSMLPQQISLYTFNALSSSLLPTFSSRTNDIENFKLVLSRIVKTSAYIIFPMMLGMIAVSENLVVFLLTEKWLPSVPILIWMCVYFAINPFRVITTQVLYAFGKSKLDMSLECLRMFMLFISTAFIMFILKEDIYVLSFTNVLVAVAFTMIKLSSLKKMVGYKLTEWIKDIVPSLLMSIVMMAFAYWIGVISPFGVTGTLFLQGISGVIIYTAMSMLFKVKGYSEILGVIRLFIDKVLHRREVRHE